MTSELRLEPDHSSADEGTIVVRIAGELDPLTAPVLLREAQALIFTGAPSELVLDFRAVTFMDSSGVRVIIDLHNQLRDSGSRLVLEQVPDTPRRVLEVTGLTEHLEIR